MTAPALRGRGRSAKRGRGGGLQSEAYMVETGEGARPLPVGPSLNGDIHPKAVHTCDVSKGIVKRERLGIRSPEEHCPLKSNNPRSAGQSLGCIHTSRKRKPRAPLRSSGSRKKTVSRRNPAVLPFTRRGRARRSGSSRSVRPVRSGCRVRGRRSRGSRMRGSRSARYQARNRRG